MEIRSSAAGILQLRKTGNQKIISGYAVKWDKWSEKIYEGGSFFYERVKKGAFRESLKDKDQIALFLHNPNDYLGSVEEGSLQLEEDDIGLCFKLTLPENPVGHILFSEIKMKHLLHVSFAFRDAKYIQETKKHEHYRTLHKARLVEISLVYNPAYPDSTVVEGDRRVNLLLQGKLDQALEQIQRQQILNQIKRALQY